jgi:hypothetical protein
MYTNTKDGVKKGSAESTEENKNGIVDDFCSDNFFHSAQVF